MIYTLRSTVHPFFMYIPTTDIANIFSSYTQLCIAIHSSVLLLPPLHITISVGSERTYRRSNNKYNKLDASSSILGMYYIPRSCFFNNIGRSLKSFVTRKKTDILSTLFYIPL